jgi:hypothetical protein
VPVASLQSIADWSRYNIIQETKGERTRFIHLFIIIIIKNRLDIWKEKEQSVTERDNKKSAGVSTE